MKKVALVSPTTQARVQAAVGDANHSMLLTNRVTSDGRTTISGATITDNAGATSPVSLPELESATLVPWVKGYAVGGAHCAASSTDGIEHQCLDWIPTVVFLNPDGSVAKVVTAEEQKQTNDDFVTVSPGGETVIFRVTEQTWELVDETGFSQAPGTSGMTSVCRLLDGTLIGVTDESSSSDLSHAEQASGQLRFSKFADGKWTSLGDAAIYDPSKGTSSMLNCVVGGMVTTMGVVRDQSGLRGVPLSMESYGTPSDTVADAVGFDPLGRLYVAIPPAENLPPQVLDGTPPGTISASDRWVGLNADGTHAVFGGTDQTTIVTTGN